MAHYTISQLAGLFDLSRSTLLYYHRCGLLVPSGRSRANYRLYSESDRERMERIQSYRALGLSLSRIATLLDGHRGEPFERLLEERLEELERDIRQLRRQQAVIVALLRERGTQPENAPMDKAAWTELMRASGLDDQAMHQWHIEFERSSPSAHRDFLASLGLDDKDINRIRHWSGMVE